MATYHVSADGSNTSPYDTWAKAATAFGTAVTAATASGDVILVDKDHTDTLSANTTYTFANNVSVLCVDKDNANELATMGTAAWIGHSTTTYDINLAGAYRVYLRGLTFRIAGASANYSDWNTTDGGHFEFEGCYFWLNSSSATLMNVGAQNVNNNYVRFKGCTFRFGHSSQKLCLASRCEFEASTISADGSVPTLLIGSDNTSGNSAIDVIDCDLSLVTGTLIGNMAGGEQLVRFLNCKFGSGVTVLATQTSNPNKSSGQAWTYNCASGDQHYHLGHYDAFGSTVVDTGIYANDGARYDGSNRCSWKIVTTANCSFYTPYVSPWFSVYHSGTSAITPYVEILRDGSTTAYQNDEVWVEFSYQGTSGSPLGVLVNDRMTPLGTPADQDAGVGTSGWTGDTGAWSGKLQATASITPAEIGHMMARICVGEPSITVYADPTIRGRT